MNTPPRLIMAVLGSENDLEQCVAGLEHLQTAKRLGLVGDVRIEILSAHRNLDCLIETVRLAFADPVYRPDVAIAGAGWANVLTSVVWGLLRYGLRLTTPVVGVCFRDLSGSDEAVFRDQAAYMSVRYVPGSDIILVEPDATEDAFMKAARWAAEGTFPEIALPKPREPKSHTLESALTLARAKQAERTS